MPRTLKLKMKIRLDGDTWEVLGIGRHDCPSHPDMVFCHLASTTRFRQQRNGAYPIQRASWVRGQISAKS